MHDDRNNASAPITLGSIFTNKNDFERDYVDMYHVPSSRIAHLRRMGKIVRLELWRNDSGVASNWYVEKIVIENLATNSVFGFPIFRWIKAMHHYQIKHLDTSLPKHEDFPGQRQMELAEKRKAYEFDKKIHGGPAQGIDRWNDDFYFGRQRVASLNHSLIELVTEIPDNFPVTDELLKPLLEGYTIAEAIAEKKLFICNLKIIEGIYVRDGLVLCSPMALFYVDKSNQLKPIAIQLFQTIRYKNPIFTPLSPPKTWTLVKMWYNNSDAAYHQALAHLGYTHLLMEGVTVATHRNLSQSHPIFKLLAPHFMYLLAINSLNQWRMDVDGTLPAYLKRRGLEDTNVLPCYHYRNDALLLYQAITKYVRAYVDLYYTNPELLEEDGEIQSWAEELVKSRNGSEGGVGLLGVPGNGSIKTNEQLEMIVTSIIYTCSIAHASANFPQYDEYAFPPNYPGLLRGQPPNDTKKEVTDKDIMMALPDRPTTIDIMIVTTILSSKGTKSIGDYEAQYIFDPPACEILNQFQKDLKEISKIITERNLSRNPPYNCLKPEILPNSISI